MASFIMRPARNPLDTVPRTRRELLQHIWSKADLHCVDLLKAGNQWVIQAGNIQTATHVRGLQDLSFTAWENRCRAAMSQFNHKPQRT